MGENRDACKVSVGKPEEKTQLGRYSCRWEGSIKIGHKEVGCSHFTSL